ncbi:MAG: Gfo/Idh/MocA family oxidoreductase [Planctomycetota bacterium]
MSRKRYFVVGTGGRCRMFLDAICGPFREHAELAGFCDVSPTRMRAWNRYVQEKYQHTPVPMCSPDQFERLLHDSRADIVIVTSVDATHHEYIIRAMRAGCDAITEKPMTTDEEKVSMIFNVIQETGRSLKVAFNYRWQPAFSLVKEVVASGQIGRPTLVDFQWRLDTSHGADYFRRWHREKKHSGGLLVHKSTHHFDLVNWILADRPESVFAYGSLSFYGQENAESRGEQYSNERYHGEADAQGDPFALSLDDNGDGEVGLKSLYLDAEADSGYIRDRNVFHGEDKWPITAEDTMTVTARYTSGTLLSYSLIAYCPWEGERLTITGTEGQVEYFGRGQGHIIAGQSDNELAAEQYQGERYVRLQRHFESPEELKIPEAKGAHGGGDTRLLERLFLPDIAPDPLQRDATHIDGAWSVLTGAAANQSIQRKEAISLNESSVFF